MAKRPKPKKIAYELIPRQSDRGRPMYSLLDEILEEHHEELSSNGARVALAWARSWKPDADGRLRLGKCKKASDLDRELAPFDFVILLNQDYWESVRTTDAFRRALLDHELCHGAIVHDQNGDVREDEKGRPVFRVRKHDLEEFREIVDRHGLYKEDLVQMASAFKRSEVTSAGTWVGYTGLQQLLEAVGVVVDKDTIIAWTEQERHEVHVWARMHQDLDPGVRVNISMGANMPAPVARALGRETTAGDQSASSTTH